VHDGEVRGQGGGHEHGRGIHGGDGLGEAREALRGGDADVLLREGERLGPRLDPRDGLDDLGDGLEGLGPVAAPAAKADLDEAQRCGCSSGHDHRA
jgi:hypothetical protein